MRKLLFALIIFLAPSLGWAQCTGLAPGGTLCGNSGVSNNTAHFATFATFGIPTLSGNNVWTGTNTFNILPVLPNQSANTVYAGPTSGGAATPAFRALVGGDLPFPSASTLGGVESIAAVTHQWVNSISTLGVPALSQPNFTDLAGSIAGSQIPAGTVTNSMLANSSTTVNGATCTLGSTCTVGNSAPPPAGASFKNLSIKVTGNTGATLAADALVVTNGAGSYLTINTVSCAINFATTGAGGLDTGTIASATWYYIWAITKADGTQSCEASLQSTANATFLANLPATYTYFAREGAVRTASGSAQLYGTWQFGRRVQYILGLAQTTAVRQMVVGGTTGGVYAAISTSAFVPPTAMRIFGYVVEAQGTGATVVVAPNSSYSTSLSGTNNAAPIWLDGGGNAVDSRQFDFILESTNIYWLAIGTSVGTAQVVALGWEDNL